MSMTFIDAVNACPLLVGRCQSGLGALSNANRKRIDVKQGTKVKGSINVDEILATMYPNDSRWDYGIGFSPSWNSGDCVCWVEVHPASPGEIKTVLAKISFHRAWLKANAPELDSMKGEFVWIATGTVSIPQHQRRKLAVQGIKFSGRIYQL